MSRTNVVAGAIAGIEIAGSEVRVVVMSVDPGGAPQATHATRVQLSSAGATSGENLKMTLDTIAGILKAQGVARIAIIAADRNSGVIRAKLEALIELMAHQERIPTDLVAIKTVNTYEKRRGGLAAPPASGRSYERATMAALRGLGL